MSEGKQHIQPLIKICGLRDTATIQAMNGLHVDQIGFVFAKSKRQVTPAQAGLLIAEVKELKRADGKPPQTAGVFVNADLDSLQAILREAPLDIIQLHGEESPALCGRIKETFGVQVWKVFSVLENDVHGEERLAAYADVVDAVLIDTAGGGTGHTFGWEVVPRYRAAASAIGVPLYVAGGLHSDNVQTLIDAYPVDGVDVSSGVETDGVKDIHKIRTFVERVKRYNESNT